MSDTLDFLRFTGVRPRAMQLGDYDFNISCATSWELDRAAKKLPGDFTGLKIWPASDVLCRYIFKYSDEFVNKRVIELGAGTGICGIVAATFSRHVAITDGNDIVVELLNANLQANQPKGSMEAQMLYWGASSSSLQPFLTQHWDWIIGADLMYNTVAVELLLQTAKALLQSNPQSRFILTHRRRLADVDETFHTTCEQLELNVTQLEWPGDAPDRWHIYAEDTADTDIKIFMITLLPFSAEQ
eukprot:GILJ01004528.1.p1 GENE.GILJ01004528.1~~GILJ01004528.1.p1  ORF type:complete len:243 (+),score=25.99 GILJ01004528.1:206-934(+)